MSARRLIVLCFCQTNAQYSAAITKPACLNYCKRRTALLRPAERHSRHFSGAHSDIVRVHLEILSSVPTTVKKESARSASAVWLKDEAKRLRRIIVRGEIESRRWAMPISPLRSTSSKSFIG
jgi:hypothetical protein